MPELTESTQEIEAPDAQATRTRERVFSLERGEVDLETGRFPMVLATSGEATDGDILDIGGARYEKRVPLQNSHLNDVRETLGSITNLRRDLASSPQKLRGTGQIEMGGPLSAVRRDLAHMVAEGHIGAVSVRWNPGKMTARTELPKAHPARVEADNPDPRKRFGMLHETWTVQEGSLVAVPADRQAIIGRADETSGEVRAFWRSIAEGLETGEPAPLPSLETGMAVFASQARQLLTEGAELDDLLIELAMLEGARNGEPLTYADVRAALDLYQQANMSGVGTPAEPTPEPEPVPARTSPAEYDPARLLRELSGTLSSALLKSEERHRGEVAGLLYALKGK